MTNHQTPIYHGKELALEDVEFRDGYAAYSGVEIVGTKGIAETLAGDRDGRDDETMASQGREGEHGHARADLVNIVEGEQEDRFLGS